MVGLASQQPWFVAAFQVGHGSYARHETICVSWEVDLLRQITAPASGRLVDLLCLIPPWCGRSAHWTTRSIASVWTGLKAGGAEVVVFVDHAGVEFCSEMLGIEPQDVHERRLICTVAKGSRR